MDYHLKVEDKEAFKQHGRLLGTYWDEDSIESLFSEPDIRVKKKQTEFFWPFSFIVNADFMDALRKSVGRKYGIAPPDWVRGTDPEHFDDLFAWEPDDFLKFVGSVVSPRLPTHLKKG